MTLLDYTLQVPLPAPLGAGAPFQSYTDPSGDVWVAQGGVFNGAWRRARDVLVSKVCRVAALNLTAALLTVQMDGVIRDSFGLYVPSPNGLFNIPLTGWYDITYQLGATPTAGNQSFNNRLYSASAGLLAIAQAHSAGTAPLSSVISQQFYLVAGDWVQTAAVSPNAWPALTGAAPGYWTYATLEYRGTG